ncbi:hypothetical protein E4U41_000985, partial [Claviceps citrina]
MAPLRSTQRAASRWAMRIIPTLIVGTFGLATYVVAVRLCMRILDQALGRKALAVFVVVLYCLVLVLTVASYLRVFVAIQRDPGFVPLLQKDAGPGSKALAPSAAAAEKKRRNRCSRRHADPEDPPWVPPDSDPNSPGLEAFYSRDVFACELDGRPRWCSACRQWKPDRAHHSSELGRCVRKMDHLCPWVGGVVSET